MRRRYQKGAPNESHNQQYHPGEVPLFDVQQLHGSKAAHDPWNWPSETAIPQPSTNQPVSNAHPTRNNPAAQSKSYQQTPPPSSTWQQNNYYQNFPSTNQADPSHSYSTTNSDWSSAKPVQTFPQGQDHETWSARPQKHRQAASSTYGANSTQSAKPNFMPPAQDHGKTEQVRSDMYSKPQINNAENNVQPQYPYEPQVSYSQQNSGHQWMDSQTTMSYQQQIVSPVENTMSYQQQITSPVENTVPFQQQAVSPVESWNTTNTWPQTENYAPAGGYYQDQNWNQHQSTHDYSSWNSSQQHVNNSDQNSSVEYWNQPENNNSESFFNPQQNWIPETSVAPEMPVAPAQEQQVRNNEIDDLQHRDVHIAAANNYLENIDKQNLIEKHADNKTLNNQIVIENKEQLNTLLNANSFVDMNVDKQPEMNGLASNLSNQQQINLVNEFSYEQETQQFPNEEHIYKTIEPAILETPMQSFIDLNQEQIPMFSDYSYQPEFSTQQLPVKEAVIPETLSESVSNLNQEQQNIRYNVYSHPPEIPDANLLVKEYSNKLNEPVSSEMPNQVLSEPYQEQISMYNDYSYHPEIPTQQILPVNEQSMKLTESVIPEPLPDSNKEHVSTFVDYNQPAHQLPEHFNKRAESAMPELPSDSNLEKISALKNEHSLPQLQRTFSNELGHLQNNDLANNVMVEIQDKPAENVVEKENMKQDDSLNKEIPLPTEEKTPKTAKEAEIKQFQPLPSNVLILDDSPNEEVPVSTNELPVTFPPAPTLHNSQKAAAKVEKGNGKLILNKNLEDIGANLETLPENLEKPPDYVDISSSRVLRHKSRPVYVERPTASLLDIANIKPLTLMPHAPSLLVPAPVKPFIQNSVQDNQISTNKPVQASQPSDLVKTQEESKDFNSTANFNQVEPPPASKIETAPKKSPFTVEQAIEKPGLPENIVENELPNFGTSSPIEKSGLKRTYHLEDDSISQNSQADGFPKIFSSTPEINKNKQPVKSSGDNGPQLCASSLATTKSEVKTFERVPESNIPIPPPPKTDSIPQKKEEHFEKSSHLHQKVAETVSENQQIIAIHPRIPEPLPRSLSRTSLAEDYMVDQRRQEFLREDARSERNFEAPPRHADFKREPEEGGHYVRSRRNSDQGLGRSSMNDEYSGRQRSEPPTDGYHSLDSRRPPPPLQDNRSEPPADGYHSLDSRRPPPPFQDNRNRYEESYSRERDYNYPNYYDNPHFSDSRPSSRASNEEKSHRGSEHFRSYTPSGSEMERPERGGYYGRRGGPEYGDYPDRYRQNYYPPNNPRGYNYYGSYYSNMPEYSNARYYYEYQKAAWNNYYYQQQQYYGAYQGRTPQTLPQDYSQGQSSRPQSRNEISGHSNDVEQSSYLEGSVSSLPSLHSEVDASEPDVTQVKYKCAHLIVKFTPQGQLMVVNPTHTSVSRTVEFHDLSDYLSEEPVYGQLESFPGPLVKGKTLSNQIVPLCQKSKKRKQEFSSKEDQSSYIMIWELMILLLRKQGKLVGSEIADLLLEVERPSDSTSDTDLGSSSENFETIGMYTKSQDCISREEATDAFREKLLYGNKLDALDFAMKHDLWGHALFLASKIDQKTHTRVLTRFANTVTLTDPLQTLYQLMSNRQPAVVTCAMDEGWRDWKPHLAMILSNGGERPTLDRAWILTLANTLLAKNCFYAAQFCYLVIQEFGTYQEPNKLALIGSSPEQPFAEFASMEAIQWTEIYEYAASLYNSEYLSHFIPYKLLYTSWLIDYGFSEKALEYLKIMAETCNDATMLKTIFYLADQLRYPDLSVEPENDDWIKNLEMKASYVSCSSRQSVSESNMEAEIEDDNSSLPTSACDSNAPYVNNVPAVPTIPHQEQPAYEPEVYQEEAPALLYETTSSNPILQPPMYNYSNNYPTISEPSIPNVTQEPSLHQPETNQKQFYQPEMNQQQFYQPEIKQQQFYQPEIKQQQEMPPITSQPPLQQQQPMYSYEKNNGQNDVEMASQYIPSYKSFEESIHQQPRQSFSMPPTPEHMPSSPPPKPAEKTAPPKSDVKPKSDEKSKKKPSSSKSFGWIGGMFNKFLPRGPNQMILPEDKNPSIVWDETREKWVDSTGGAEDSNISDIAPPKDIDLKFKPSESLPPLPGSMPPSGNMFSLPKGRRQNYVDILKPKSNSFGASEQRPPVSNFSNPIPFNPPPINPEMNNPQQQLPPQNPPPSVIETPNQVSISSEVAPPAAISMFDPAQFAAKQQQQQQNGNNNQNLKNNRPPSINQYNYC